MTRARAARARVAGLVGVGGGAVEERVGPLELALDQADRGDVDVERGRGLVVAQRLVRAPGRDQVAERRLGGAVAQVQPAARGLGGRALGRGQVVVEPRQERSTARLRSRSPIHYKRNRVAAGVAGDESPGRRWYDGVGRPMKKFPDFVPPTKVSYLDRGPTLHLRRCSFIAVDDPRAEWSFDKDEIRIGSMDDNDVVMRDDTVSRYHCKIVQEDSGYVLVDLHSTNGTFVNKVRVREAYLKPGCTIAVGQSQIKFNAREEEVPIVPSHHDRLGLLIGGNAQDARDLHDHREDLADRDHGRDRGRDRDRQGGRRPRRSTSCRRARPASWSCSTAARSRPT